MKSSKLKRIWLLALVGFFTLNSGIQAQTSINSTTTQRNSQFAFLKFDWKNIILPKRILEYIDTHFNDFSIKAVDRKFVPNGVNYQVQLEDGVELDFNEEKRLIEIKSEKDIPDNVIPPYIELYVKKEYPNEKISEWTDKEEGHLIKLTSEECLLLNEKGTFVKVKSI